MEIIISNAIPKRCFVHRDGRKPKTADPNIDERTHAKYTKTIKKRTKRIVFLAVSLSLPVSRNKGFNMAMYPDCIK